MTESKISDLAAHCIRCGFCLESCPTFLITGKETESPRGRIYLIRSADAGVMEWGDPSLREHIDTCVGCRNCETACPSGVEYGALLELGRDRLEREHPSRAKEAVLAGVTHPRLLRIQLLVSKLTPGRRLPGFVSRLLTKEEPEADKPMPQHVIDWPELRESDMPPVKGEVGLLMGCAMEVLFPNVHLASKRLLRRVGYQTKEIHGCCGALHAHNGHLYEAKKMASKVLSENSAEALIVNSAGCGSFLKEQTPSGVFDIAEFLAANGLQGLLAAGHCSATLTYHDACHLAHGQKIKAEPRELLQSIPGLDYRELPEADLCCGSGGIYNILQPLLARQMLERKWANVESTGAKIVVTGNPGCHAWIEQRSREAGGDIRVMHTAELLEAVLSGLI